MKKAYAAVISFLHSHATPIKFLCSSCIAFLIDYVLTLSLTYFGLVMEISQSLAWICSSMTNFLLNYYIAFRADSRFFAAMGEYYSLATVIFLIKRFGFQEIAVRLVGIPLPISHILCEIITYPISYFIQKKWIFRKTNL